MKDLSDTAAAAVVAGLASCTSLKRLSLYFHSSLTVLPDLSALTSLQTLATAPSRRAARPVGAHVAEDAQPRDRPHGATAAAEGAPSPGCRGDAQLQRLNLCCNSTAATCRRSQTSGGGLPNHLKPWKALRLQGVGLHHRRLAARLHRDRPERVRRRHTPGVAVAVHERADALPP